LIRTAMAINSSWDKSAGEYVEMYRYGFLAKQWQAKRRQLVETFTQALAADQPIFAEFFSPGQQEYGDQLDWALRRFLAEQQQ